MKAIVRSHHIGFLLFFSISAFPARHVTAGGSGCNRPGPDVIIGDLLDVASWGSVGDIAAFSVGTNACNVGNEEFAWEGTTNRHPVIAQSMYRLKDGRFEQIGISWLKHAHGALQLNDCNCGCIDSDDFHMLGVGCSDPYAASFNGGQGTLPNGAAGLGPRFEVNPFTGEFPWPYTGSGLTGNAIYKRLQVNVSDLDPALAGGGLYFIEGHYVAQDDAEAGNLHNNASHRPIIVSGAGIAWSIELSGVTEPEQPAVRAWHALDPDVVETDFEVPGDGLLILASKANDLGGGSWHYEYALHNLNVSRAAGSFAVPVDPGAMITSIGFHDVSYHSGEPFDGSDWPGVAGDGAVSWSTTDFAVQPNANALRWGTLYNFRFDADQPPGHGEVTIGLFEPGTPAAVAVAAIVPVGDLSVCNDGQVGFGEECDPPDGLHCDAMCQWICGDGVVQDGEECDPSDGLHCDAQCQWICGDGVVQDGEQCDDGNTVSGDGCAGDCQSGIYDGCDVAAPISDGVTAFCSIGATTDGADHGFGACHPTTHGQVYNDIWYDYQATCTGTLLLTTCGELGGIASFDTRIAVYDGCTSTPCTDGLFLGCNDDDPVNPCGTDAGGFESTLEVPVQEGTCYKVRLGSFAANQDGVGLILLHCASDGGIPTTNEWGLLALALLTLSAGTILFAARLR